MFCESPDDLMLGWKVGKRDRFEKIPLRRNCCAAPHVALDSSQVSLKKNDFMRPIKWSCKLVHHDLTGPNETTLSQGLSQGLHRWLLLVGAQEKNPLG